MLFEFIACPLLPLHSANIGPTDFLVRRRIRRAVISARA